MLYGLDIGGTKIELAVFNEKLEKQYSERIATPKEDYQEWLNAIVGLVQKADQQFQCKGKVGLGIPGFIHNETGLAEITNIRAANGKPILTDLATLLDREIRAENDANCFALSEAMDEENRHYKAVLGLILGTGFGGGFVFNGKVYSGLVGMAGEVGHLKLNYLALNLLGGENAPIYPCGCGAKGCLDNYLSGRGFEMLYRDLVGESLSAKAIIQQFYDNQVQAVEFVEKFVKLTACSLADIITAFDPPLIVFGGGLSNFDYLYERLPQVLPQYLLKSAQVPLIKKAKYGDSGGTRGAAALWIENRFI